MFDNLNTRVCNCNALAVHEAHKAFPFRHENPVVPVAQVATKTDANAIAASRDGTEATAEPRTIDASETPSVSLLAAGLLGIGFLVSRRGARLR